MKPNRLLMTTAVSAALASPVFATDILEEVVVTAQKREQSINDVAMAITAVTGDVARTMGIQDTRDVAFIATNMDIKGAGMSDANPAVTLRGIGMNNFNANNNPSVGIYLDEVFLASPAMINLSYMDLGRIEVLKGPQGTLYGRNATGGAVNIVSAKPTDEFEGFVSVSLGEYETTLVEGAISGPLTDNLSGRISFMYDGQGENFHSYHKDGGGMGEFNDLETYGFRAQLGGNTDNLTWNLKVEYLDQDMGNSPFTAVGGWWNSIDEVFVTPCQGALNNCVSTLGIDVSDQDGDPFTHNFTNSRVDEMNIASEVTGATFNFTYDFDAFSLTSISSMIQQDRDFGENIWSNDLEFFAVYHEEEMDQWSQEFRLSGELGMAQWIAGVYFWNDTYKSDNIANSEWILGVLAGLNPLDWKVDQETDAYALFASVDWQLADRWLLTTGVRYSDEETSFKGGTNGTIVDSAAFDFFVGVELGLPNGITIPFTEMDDEISESNTDVRVALEFRPSDETMIYGSVTTGFKSGGYFGDFTFDQFELEPFTSETVTAYEIGFKSGLAGGKVQVNGSAFMYDYEDIQTFVPSSLGFRLANLEEADISGVELEVLASVTDGLDIRFGAGFLDSEVSSQYADYDGNSLPNAPETQVTGTIRYQFPMTSSLNLVLQADAKYTDSMYRESTNNPWLSSDSYTVVNARVGVAADSGKWELAAWAKNLTDEEYTQEVFGSDIIGMVTALYGNPRQYGVTLNYNF